MGEFWTPQHRKKKINEHRITATKVNETPSPPHVFLAPWFVHLPLKEYFYTSTIFHKINTTQCSLCICRYQETDAGKSVSLLLWRNVPQSWESRRRKQRGMAFTPDPSLLSRPSLFLEYKPTDWSPIDWKYCFPELAAFAPLDIGLVLFMRGYGPRLRLGPKHTQKRTWPISSQPKLSTA